MTTAGSPMGQHGREPVPGCEPAGQGLALGPPTWVHEAAGQGSYLFSIEGQESLSVLLLKF